MTYSDVMTAIISITKLTGYNQATGYNMDFDDFEGNAQNINMIYISWNDLNTGNESSSGKFQTLSDQITIYLKVGITSKDDKFAALGKLRELVCQINANHRFKQTDINYTRKISLPSTISAIDTDSSEKFTSFEIPLIIN